MPIYEFGCQGCGTTFEKLCGISSDGSDIACPNCESSDVKRLISSFYSRISGSGGSASSGCNCGGCCKSSCAGCHH